MARKSDVTYDDDAPQFTDAELAEFRPAGEIHSPEEMAALASVRPRGRPVAASPKVPVTIRLDAHIVEAFKATGRGWQTKMNEALAASLAGTPATEPQGGRRPRRTREAQPARASGPRRSGARA